MQATKWQAKTIDIGLLIPMENNPRMIDDASLVALTASMRRFGCVEPIVWNERTGHILGGHQRYGVLKSLGEKQVMVVAVDFDEATEGAINLTLNNSALEGQWDEPLTSLLNQLKENSSSLYDELRLTNLEHAVAEQKQEKESAIVELNRELDVDDLVADCDTACPCCGFKWQVDSRDITVE